MSEYVSAVTTDKYFICCRCNKGTDVNENSLTWDDVYWDWDFDTEEEYREVFKEGEHQIHRDCERWKEDCYTNASVPLEQALKENKKNDEVDTDG